MNIEIGYIHCPLEGRFSEVRTKECNLGEYVYHSLTQIVEDDSIFLSNV